VDDVAEHDDGQPATDYADGEQDEEDSREVQGGGSRWWFERSNGLELSEAEVDSSAAGTDQTHP
jgi:hypothetical protein